MSNRSPKVHNNLAVCALFSIFILAGYPNSLTLAQSSCRERVSPSYRFSEPGVPFYECSSFPRTVTAATGGVGEVPIDISYNGGILLADGSATYASVFRYEECETTNFTPTITVHFTKPVSEVMYHIKQSVASWPPWGVDITATDNLGNTVHHYVVQTGPNTWEGRTERNGTLLAPGERPFPGPGVTDITFVNNFYKSDGSWDFGISIFAFVQCYPADGAENLGKVSCNASRGEPVNVTNGNMYLEQSDYSLPSAGPGLNVTRTYNSKSPNIGVFGRGWSSTYDQSINIITPAYVRWLKPDGQATNFNGSSSFTAAEGDFHGSLVKNSGGSFTLTLNDGSVRQFNSAGKLTALIDRRGNQTTLAYGANNRIASITDPFGRVLNVTTNSNGRVLSISDSLGTIATYTYGSSNQLLSVTYADNSGFTFEYDGGLRLTTVYDALENVVEGHAYDAFGRAISSYRHGGVDGYTFNYVNATQTDVTDALGRTTKFTFNTSMARNAVTRVEGMCNCGGSQVQTWTYDSQMNITSKTDALGHVMTYTYDLNGNPLTETNASGTITYTYDAFGNVLTRADQLNNPTTNSYDSQGNLLTSTDALNNTTTFTYNARGQMLTATDARGKATTFTYDSSGNVTQKKDANNIITFFFYDARRRPTKVRDGLSRSTLFAYDAAGRINKVTHPDLSFITFLYDLGGRRTRVTDERGNPTNYNYDFASRLTAVTDAANQATEYVYDQMSNLVTTIDALSRETVYEYDDFNRVKKITYPPAEEGATPLFETVAYDADGNVTSRTDTAGRVTSYAYDNVDRVASTTDAANKTTTFAYDALSRVTSVTDAINQQHQFVYDALGRQTEITRGGVTMSYAYDEVANRTQRTDYNGVVTTYSYDNLNRLTTITYPSRSVTYAYDPLNNVTRATNENGSVYISYDNRYRVSSFSDPFYYGISYNYDTAGNRTKLKVNGATYATYTYDSANRLTNLADSASLNFTYNYDAGNRLTSRSAPNGVVSSYAYDGLDRLTSLMHTAGGTTLSGNLYTYNNANNISSWTTATTQKAFTYDALDRLTNVTNYEMPAENYSYDGVGNRTASHLSASYGYQPFNKLNSTATATYNYDNNGNLISKSDASGTATFTFNEERQLTQVILPSGLTVNYKYDGLGRRIQRTTSAGANERYVYDGHDALIDLNADWSVATTYFNNLGIDDHLRQTSATTGVSYFLPDHLGSSVGLTDISGNVIEQLSYDSFGNSAGTSRTRYGYTGRERDPDTGQLYYRARFYDPQVGRFLSEDPVHFAGGDVNVYSYVSNNPISYSDPSGLWSPEAHREIIRRAFKDCLSEAQMKTLIDESDYMDGVLNGGAWKEEHAYQHKMRAPYETVDGARNAAEGWVAASLREAGQKRRSFEARHPLLNGITVGLKNFGQALHTITDGFSPAHEGYQVWQGPPMPGLNPFANVRKGREYGQYVRAHRAQESLDALLSDQARLDRIIKAARDAFFKAFGENACECNF